MSWWPRSIANSLKLDDNDEDEDEVKIVPKPEPQNDDASSPTSPSRGVKEDLSELTKTLTSQFWGVASFLAPPPLPEPKSDPETSEPEPDSLLGIKGDFAEIGGKFRSGISRLSNNINVSEITKIASNFLQLESDGEDEETGKREGLDSLSEGAVGVTEEVVAFVRDIAMHPETWLDFPLPDTVGDDVERVVILIGVSYRIVEARALLAHELKNRTTTKPEDVSEKKSFDSEETAVSHHEEPLSVPSPVISEKKQDEASDLKISTSTTQATSEIMKPSVDSNKSQIVEKSVIEEKDGSKVKNPFPKSGPVNVEKDDDDADDWLKEETSEISGAVGNTVPIENEDDVSFSDLEEDDDGDVPTSYRKSNYSSSDKDSRDWVQLGKSSSDVKHSSDNENANKESNDWLDVDDIVVA
ncbi:hypothetical protein BUALT_Bualt04G0098800 [Buddleja alternifolia]|uniref:BSD domain-containing protein n=1 Tax=Buddleja alternifolia TaxID=168488 RepID=A0AAV6XU50_9LAMI|nr:hypothetical protein BUALT_Bualt04G0098800 [Buddleja alternifolia]